MDWRRFLMTCAVVLSLGTLGVIPGCGGSQDDSGEPMEETTEGAGEAAEETGEAMQDAAEEAGDAVENAADEAEDAVE